MSRYFEDFEIGQVFRHAVHRTVTETDNLLFTALTHNTQPLHLDEEFAKQSEHGGRIFNSVFTFAFVVGVSVDEISRGTLIGALGFENVSMPRPVRIGDTLRAETTVFAKRRSKSRPDAGLVTFDDIGLNQRDEIVIKIRRTLLMKARTSVAA